MGRFSSAFLPNPDQNKPLKFALFVSTKILAVLEGECAPNFFTQKNWFNFHQLPGVQIIRLFGALFVNSLFLFSSVN